MDSRIDTPLESGTSGDPLLKRLVDLAHLGWTAEIVVLSNGYFFVGQLISGADYRAALAASIRSGEGSADLYAELNEIIAAVVEADDPPPAGEAEGPEPRFVHLANVRDLSGSATLTPFLRLRLPAVSGFWIRRLGERSG